MKQEVPNNARQIDSSMTEKEMHSERDIRGTRDQ